MDDSLEALLGESKLEVGLYASNIMSFVFKIIMCVSVEI